MAKKFVGDPETGTVRLDTSRHQTMTIDHGEEPEKLDLSYLERVSPTRNALTGEVHGEPTPEQEPEAKDTGTVKEGEPDKETPPAVAAKPPEAEEGVDWQKRYEEQRKLHARQDSELGQLRRMVDTHLMTFPQKPPEPTKPEDLVDRFVKDPESVIREIEDRAVGKAMAGFKQQSDIQSKLDRLNTKHPDREQVVQTVEFRDWLTIKSGIPPSFISVAESDPEAAAFVLDQFKTTGGISKPAAQTNLADPKAVAEKIATKRRMAANATGVGASSGGEGDKIFSRYDLIEMQSREPEKYALMQPEIMQAYRDGRVR